MFNAKDERELPSKRIEGEGEETFTCKTDETLNNGADQAIVG
jgi:hypothetical protein